MEEAHDKSAEISDVRDMDHSVLCCVHAYQMHLLFYWQGELHVKELDNLEKVLDSALVKFESTTL